MTNGYKKVGFGFELDFTDKTTRQIAEARRQVSGMENDTKGMAKSFTAQIDKIENRLAKSRRGFKTSLKVMGAGAAILAPFALMTRSAMKAEDTWGDVATLLAASGDSMDVIDAKLARFQSRVDKVGSRIGIPLEEFEAGWYRLQSALGEEQAMAGIEQVGKLALATKGELAEAIDLATSQMKTFGDMWIGMTDADKFTRIMNAASGTVAAYNTDLGNLQEAMKFVSGRASQMNMSIEETNSLLGTLQTRGLQGGRAGSSLNMMLTQLLLAPEKIANMAKKGKKRGAGTIADLVDPETVSKMSKQLKKLAAIRLTDTHGQLLPIVDILKQMEIAFGITSAKSKEAIEKVNKAGLEGAEAWGALGLNVDQATILQKAFGDEGSRALLMLLGQSDAIKEQSAYLKEANVLQDMFQAKNRNTARQLAIATNKIKSQVRTIGNQLLPAFRDVLHLGGDVLGWIKKFNEAHPNITKWMTWGTIAGGALTFVGGAAAAVYFKLRMLSDLRSLLMLQRQIAGVTVAQHAWNAAIWKSPIFRLLAAVGIGVAAGKLVYDKFLRGWLPGTEYLRKGGAPDFLSAMDAGVDLQKWSLPDQLQIGENMASGFTGQVDQHLGESAGERFGKAAAKGYMTFQEQLAREKARKEWKALTPSEALRKQLGYDKKDNSNIFQKTIDALLISRGLAPQYLPTMNRYRQPFNYPNERPTIKARPLLTLSEGGYRPSPTWSDPRQSAATIRVEQHIDKVIINTNADAKDVKREFDKQMTEEALLAPTGKL